MNTPRVFRLQRLWPGVQPLAEHEWTHRMPQGQHATVLELLAQIDATLTQSA